jgi:D-lactate dehydrogenase (cytochrome)
MKKTHAAFSSLPQVPEGDLAAVYVEFHADNEDILNDTLLSLSDIITDCGGNEDTTWFATEPRELERLTFFRHAVPEAVNLYIDMRKKEGLALTKLGTDMAVQNTHLDDVYRLYKSTLKESKLHAVMFGHIGDNHIHVNILPVSEQEYEKGKRLYKEWAEQITGFGGSVSAEHGIGKLKTDFLTIMYGEQGAREMYAVKKVFDPHMILNPGNLFPSKQYMK